MIPITVPQIIEGASNIRAGNNPPLSIDDFREIFPQFWDSSGNPFVPEAVIDMYIGFANGIVNIARYHESWKICFCFVVAHFLTLYMRTMTPEGNESASAVIRAAETRGLVTSKNVGSVSVSYDYSTAISDLDGWAAWKTTEFGIQFLTLAKVYNLGGMRVW
ncbi:hypothetical protein FACS1894187_07100 [Synergistales bacterium]|nr:hypothetical protein FACS1894187_07100 [Synergistales bacterium]